MNPILEKARVTSGRFGSCAEDGFNGMFVLQVNGEELRCIASDGMGWRHVSVSKVGSSKPPNWSHMCFIKNLFWGPDAWVVQFHPAQSDYVNNHPGCLHLWEPTEQPLPKPDSLLVGHKALNPEEVSKRGYDWAMKQYDKANAAPAP